MKPFFEKILTGSRFAGLEVQLTTEGKLLHLVMLKRKGKEVIIEKQITGIDSFEKLAGHLSAEIPLAIRITGKGILYRRIEADAETEKSKLLSKIFPNASLKDFRLEITGGPGDSIVVSVLRSSVAEEIIREAEKFSLVGSGVGSPAVVNVLPLFGEPRPEIFFGKHSLHFSNEELSEVQYDETLNASGELSTGGQTIPAIALPAFAAAFEQVAPWKNGSAFTSRAAFLQKKLFRKGMIALLSFIFFALLINFLFFSFYRGECNELRVKLESTGGASDALAQLENRLAEKKKFVTATGMTGIAHQAWYADRLAASVPPEITLTEMNLSPRVQLADEDSIGFMPGEIVLTGNCSESIFLNNWIQELKKEKWIKTAGLKKYLWDKTMTRGEFYVLLDLQ
jgi:hypothetical protein